MEKGKMYIRSARGVLALCTCAMDMDDTPIATLVVVSAIDGMIYKAGDTIAAAGPELNDYHEAEIAIVEKSSLAICASFEHN